MESYKIWTHQDIESIPTDTPIHLEIYLRNAVIPLQHINANCAVRAEGCKFPNLTLVKGNLSIDARAAKFPVLKTVEGDCDIHCLGIELPCLQCVKGVLSIEANVPLYALKTVGNRLENKAKIRLPNLTEFGKKTWQIHTMSNVAQLPLDGRFNLEIRGNDLTIPHTSIDGYVRIKGKHITFPNLHTVKKIIIERVEDGDSNHQILLPQLRTISVNCIIRDGLLVAPQLEQIKNKMIVEDNGFGEFPNLKTVHFFSFSSTKRVNFPSLQKIFGNFYCIKRPPLSYYPALNSSIEPHCFPRLNTIHGNAHINDDSDLPALETINGTLTFAATKIFPSIKKIGNLNLGIIKSNAPYLPNIESIHNALYHESIGYIASKVEHLFFQVTKTLFVSKDRFFVFNDWHGSNISDLWRFPTSTLDQLVSILKMRHTSFQNFITNEFEQEWLNRNELMKEMLKFIEQKWYQVPTYSLQDIDNTANHNLISLSYPYIPIVKVMRMLNAKCISAKGFDVRCSRYDTLGDKIAFSQHHTYEIYEADSMTINNLKYWNHRDKRYAVKCTCTYNEYEQWFWVEERYKSDPLEAIASTIKMHENVIPFIKSIKRKGDTIVFEMKEEVTPLGNARPLTKREYFGLLEVEI
jgi:hypothetical protein